MNSNLNLKSSPAPINFVIALNELILDLLSLIPNIYFIYLLWTRQDLHNNLRVLLSSFSSSLIIIALTRLPTQSNYIFTGILYIECFGWLVYGHEIAVMFFRTIIVPLTFERVLATIYSKNYEQKNHQKLEFLIICILIGIYIGSELNNSSIRNGVISFRGRYYGLYHIIDVSILFFNLHFDFIMLRIAYNQQYFNIEYSQSFDFILALALNAIPISAILSHSTIALLTGQKLIFGKEEEEKVYFDELRKSWNIPINEIKNKKNIN
ncbi:hypothetical protein Mgra_00001559 [Meloidogyne graminicola]|uniref:Uncharacterized protein n=1 Tax=Meloidogyne graminicola TaxID=189291 RepID=A0A8T0A1R0_9BILA|nr:hypothetical protein Mgra_00001559 [Meloidogyne graminicola]